MASDSNDLKVREKNIRDMKIRKLESELEWVNESIENLAERRKAVKNDWIDIVCPYKVGDPIRIILEGIGNPVTFYVDAIVTAGGRDLSWVIECSNPYTGVRISLSSVYVEKLSKEGRLLHGHELTIGERVDLESAIQLAAQPGASGARPGDDRSVGEGACGDRSPGSE